MCINFYMSLSTLYEYSVPIHVQCTCNNGIIKIYMKALLLVNISVVLVNYKYMYMYNYMYN